MGYYNLLLVGGGFIGWRVCPGRAARRAPCFATVQFRFDILAYPGQAVCLWRRFDQTAIRHRHQLIFSNMTVRTAAGLHPPRAARGVGRDQQHDKGAGRIKPAAGCDACNATGRLAMRQSSPFQREMVAKQPLGFDGWFLLRCNIVFAGYRCEVVMQRLGHHRCG
jgi:hypothetical protein